MLKLATLLAVVFVFGSCEKEEIIDVNGLPSMASNFLNENFNEIKVLSVIREKETLSGTEYQVLLNNGVEVKFDKSGNWIEVDARENLASIPTGFILAPIVSYVVDNYKDAGVNSIEKENYGFDVELTNGLDLVFDKDGKFIRIDP